MTLGGEGHVLVTGASRGIGEAIARRLAAAGRDLVLVARTAGDLERVRAAILAAHPGRDVRTLAADLAEPAERERLAAWLDGGGGGGVRLGGLVNNAGLGTFGRFEAIDPALETLMIRVNVEALTHLAHLAATRLRGVPGAFILNLGSIASFQAVPYFAAYAATKAYVLSLTEALAAELRPSGIRAICLCPGFTATDFQRVARIRDQAAGMGDAATPEAVADLALRAIARGRTIAIGGGLVARLRIHSQRLAPRRVVAWVTRRLMARILAGNEAAAQASP